MKIRDATASGKCEGCGEKTDELSVVTFERADKVFLLCRLCLSWAKDVLELVDVKEAEA